MVTKKTKNSLALMTMAAAISAGAGVDITRIMNSYSSGNRSNKNKLSKTEQDLKIFKAEKKRLDKALKKQQITQAEHDIRLKRAKQKTVEDAIVKEELRKEFVKDFKHYDTGL